MIDVDMIKREIEYNVDELSGKKEVKFSLNFIRRFEITSRNFVGKAIDIRYQERSCEIFAQKKYNNIL